MSDSKKIIQWLIAILIPLTMLLIPTNEVFTPMLAKFFLVTLLGILLLLFELVEPAVAGLIFITGYPLVGIMGVKDALANFATPVMIQIICCLLLVEVVSNTKLLDRVAYNLIVKTGGSYLGIIFGLGIIGLVFALLIPSASAGMIVLFLGLGICKGMNIEPKSNMAVGIMVMAGFTVSFAQHYLYSATGVGVSLALLQGAMGTEVSYLDIFKDNIVMIPEAIIMCFILAKLFKPENELNSKEYFTQKLQELGKWEANEKKVLGILIAMFLFFVTNKWHHMDMTFGFLLACVAFYLPFINVGTKQNLKGVSIDIVLVVAGCMLIGTAGAACNIKDLITMILYPILQSGNGIVFVAVAWVSGVLANMLMTPLALMTTLTIPLAQIGANMGIQPQVVAYILSHCAEYVFFPYESTSILIMYSFGMMNMKQFMKAAVCITLVGGIFTILVSGVYWMAIGLI